MIRTALAISTAVGLCLVAAAVAVSIVMFSMEAVAEQARQAHPHVVVCPSGTSPVTPYYGDPPAGDPPVIFCVSDGDEQAPIAQ